MQTNLRTRYRVTKIMRDYLGDLGFWEIETPFLTKSHPGGGARFHRSVAAGTRAAFMPCRSRRSFSSSF